MIFLPFPASPSKNSEAYKHLSLHKRFRRGAYNWHRDASTLVDRLISRTDAVEAVAEYGYTIEDLTAIQNGLKQIDSLQERRLKEAGEAEQATKDRDAAMDLLDSWMDKFFTIAPIALRSQPQWLEQLGIVVH